MNYEQPPIAENGNPLKKLRQEARQLIEQRCENASKMRKDNFSINEVIKEQDNDYSKLEELFVAATGYELISDSKEGQQHEIPITKSCSIVIPTYNNSAHLEKCLLSIQASSFNAKYPQQIEVVIVDDGSPNENIAEQISKIGLSDLNVTVLRQSNGRVGKARYSGALAATGDIVIYTDPDIIYTPSMIEEYMKRHQILDGFVSFGFRDSIDDQDPRISAEQIVAGSLSALPDDISTDQRVRDRSMADCDWLKKSGHNTDLPIDIEYIDWRWKLKSIAWGMSVSASREDLIRVKAAYDPDYVGWGNEDEQLTASLVSLGRFVIPNSGGFSYHQDHPTNFKLEQRNKNAIVFENNMNNPVQLQSLDQPEQTDAQTVLEIINPRHDRSPETLPKTSPEIIANRLLNMGITGRAALYFKTTVDKMMSNKADVDPQLLAKYAKSLLESGDIGDLQEAIGALEIALDELPQDATLHLQAAELYARTDRFAESRHHFAAALALEPDNQIAKRILVNPEELHVHGKKLLDAGKVHLALYYFDTELAAAGGIHSRPWAAFDKATCYLRTENYSVALQLLSKVHEELGDNTWVLSKIAEALTLLGRNKEAKSYFQAALSIDPNNHEALNALK